jgi:hypothetical protein
MPIRNNSLYIYNYYKGMKKVENILLTGKLYKSKQSTKYKIIYQSGESKILMESNIFTYIYYSTHIETCAYVGEHMYAPISTVHLAYAHYCNFTTTKNERVVTSYETTWICKLEFNTNQSKFISFGPLNYTCLSWCHLRLPDGAIFKTGKFSWNISKLLI